MKAWVQDRYGDAGVLKRAELPVPSPRPNEVLVRVHTAGLNAADVHQMTGEPYLARLAFGVRRPRQPVLGSDFAGTVERVGSEVTHVAAGDAVMGEVDRGSLADFVAVKGKSVVRAPASVSLTDAAALPMAALTALQAVRDVAKVQPGDAVLVNGASSGVGVYAVQLAVAAGAKVTAVCSTGNVELVRSIGAHDVVDYTATDIAALNQRFDAIVDIVSSKSVATMRRLLTERGRLAVVGAVDKGSWIGVGQQIRGTLVSPFVSQSLRMFLATITRDDLDEVARLVDAGDLRPVIDRVFAFAEAPDALRHLASHRARGKVVVSVSE